MQAQASVDAVSFREATPADAAALGRVHVASWRETYAGLLPDLLLDGLSADARADMWRRVLEDPATHGATLFVAESGGGIAGFAACFPQRDAALRARGFEGELGAIYVLRAHQRGGVGRALMGLMARRLLGGGVTAAALWVLATNSPARGFYETLGGTLAGEKSEEESGVTLREVAYGWTDLTALLPDA